MDSIRTGARGKEEASQLVRDFDTVIFVPATPGSQLKHRYMREIKATAFM